MLCERLHVVQVPTRVVAPVVMVRVMREVSYNQ